MHLSQLAAKPKLIEVIIESEEIIKEYGEPLAFHTWDRQPMETFMKLVSLSGKDVPELFNVVKTLILDSEGKEILTDDKVLPTNVLMEVTNKVTELLGKS
jgi:hypothetical protein